MDLVRRDLRVKVTKPQHNLQVVVIGSEKDKASDLRITNLSRGGFFMAGNAALSAAQDIAVKIPVDFGGKEIQASGTVSWVRSADSNPSQPQGAGIFLKEFRNGTESIWRELIARCLYDLSSRDLMDARFVSVSVDATVAEAVAVLQKAGKKALVVVNAERAPVGVFEADDILRLIDGASIKNAALRSLIDPLFRHASTGGSITDLFDVFRFTDQKHLPLIEEGKVIGLISKDSLIPYWAEFMEFKIEMSRRDFQKGLGIIAHELKTPLAIIETSNQLLLSGAVEAGEYQSREIPLLIDQSARVAGRLVDDILTLSTTGVLEQSLRLKKLDLTTLLKSSAQSFKEIAGKKNIGLKVQLPKHPLAVNADPEKLIQVLNNLINNAIKFSPNKTTIELRVEVLAGKVAINVIDEGPGIPLDEQSELFREFPNISTRPTGNEKKTGLGLAITKKIVEAHGGSIFAKNREPNGAVFTVLLPLSEN